ncbi:hypothetical protein BON22_1282 [Cyberlindnera fabianii]|uniref:Uncharacterized protein n=1 Tax=Cyberlindnera fabianii TaxID=36022 RepID=A0A1V2LBJ9_CYBFA|nr:hypothetical protein BON22_1282 [Cyberlindnera fabianii]
MEIPRTVQTHRESLNRLTDDILNKSSATLEKIEENIRLTHALRVSSAMITQMDSRIDLLTRNLHQYQSYLTQLNSLMMRSEFFESQLSMFEAEQQVNAMRKRRGLPCLHNWKDEDLNWRTTASTLENLTSLNLNLNLNLLTNQVLTTPQNSQNQLLTPDTTLDETIFSHSSPMEHETAAAEALPTPQIKPPSSPLASRTRSATRKHTRCKSSPLVLKELIMTSTDADDIHSTGLSIQAQKFNLRHFISHDTGLKTKVNQQDLDDEKGVKDSEFLNSPASLKIDEYLAKKIDCSTKELSETDENKQDNEGTQDTRKEEEAKEEGAGEEHLDEETCDKDAKDDSVISFGRRGLSLAPPAAVLSGPTISPSVKESSCAEDFKSQLPTFEHKLNRSNSCDSIFSVMTSRIPVQPGKDSRAQTLLWMQMFSKPQTATKEETPTVSKVSANNLTVTSNGSTTTKQALSNLVSHSRKLEATPKPSNAFSSWFSRSSKQPSTTIARESAASVSTKGSEPSPFGASFFGSLLGSKTKAPPKSSPLASVTEEPTAPAKSKSKYHSFESCTSPTSNEEGWPRLVNKLTPQSMLKSTAVVTSEVGKRSIAPSISSTQPQRANAWNVTTREQIKGSFSTLTMGPHGSKIVQHGESSSMSTSLVVSSRVSHAALKDALANDLVFD